MARALAQHVSCELVTFGAEAAIMERRILAGAD